MHLYFHVPFCARRCSYCDFAIAVRRDVPSAEYRDAVLHEWAGWQQAPVWDGAPEVRTIYFGGGTPSRLDPVELAAILDRVRADRPVASDAEVTLEANPEDLSPDRVEVWVGAGINRVSLGVQSFDPVVLTWMHRTHSPADVSRAVAVLRAAGIGNLSLDLIYGLPGDLGRDWDRDVALALELEPEHLSLYGLTVEPGTPLFRWTRRGESPPVPDDRAASEYLAAHRAMAAAGFIPYEVSNSARPGWRSRHNSAYWERTTFLGLGPSAHGGAAAARWWNVREWAEYARRFREGKPLLAGREELSPAAMRLEELYLGLRTDRGVPAGTVPAARAAEWEAAGWAATRAGTLVLTLEGWLRLDALVAALPDP